MPIEPLQVTGPHLEDVDVVDEDAIDRAAVEVCEVTVGRDGVVEARSLWQRPGLKVLIRGGLGAHSLVVYRILHPEPGSRCSTILENIVDLPLVQPISPANDEYARARDNCSMPSSTTKSNLK